MENNFLNLIKSIYVKFTANILFNGKILNAKVKIRQRYLHLKHCTMCPNKSIASTKEIKGL